MDRSLTYAQEQARSTDFMFAQRSAMIGLAKLAEAIIGTGTFMSGLGCVPTSPASMSVQVNPGQIFSLENVDSTAFGILAADTTHQILKQGLMQDAVQLACSAPTTSGYSINYLIQVAFQETDTTNVVLPFFNSANPSQPYSGQNNTGTALPTERQDQCIVAVKAGAAAATGSQTTPAPDAGYIGAYVVTVAYGQTTITSTSISVYPNAPFLPSDGVFRGLQLGEAMYATDTGTANALAFALSPAPAALKDGMVFRCKAANDNTGPTTVNPNSIGNIPAYANGAAMVGGEIKAGGYYEFEYDATNNVAHLMAQSKGLLAGAFIGGNKSVFTANGTFVVPANVTKIWVSACAGGGGGGGSFSTSGASSGGAGGGGAGQSIQKVGYVVTPGQSLAATIGSGGTGGPVGTPGSAGGATSLGALFTLTGGSGGQAGGASSTTNSAGGAGGSGFPSGSSGLDSGSALGAGSSSGKGASSPFGGGGPGVKGNGGSANGGGAGGGFGAGGSGAGGINANAGGTGAAGGSGSAGFVVIEW